VEDAAVVVGGSGRCWVDGVGADEAVGAVADSVGAAGVGAVPAAEDLVDSEAVAAAAEGLPVVGERVS
jgi:hypothetical protein